MTCNVFSGTLNPAQFVLYNLYNCDFTGCQLIKEPKKTYNNNMLNSCLSSTVQVSRYQKKRSPNHFLLWY